jgi:HAD superfamily hydrolase (TIGR01484 family)
MRYLVLACDFDGTLAHEGIVDEAVVKALERYRASGRHLILVTGRELADLARTFPQLDQFDYVVAENGATLYHPATRDEKPLAEPPPAEFVAALRAAGVSPISVGRVIVATWSPHETAVLETIRNLGLELQVIFNKGAVMVLPSGINKATGLAAALEKMGISGHNVVAVGDAENDNALLSFAEASVAVANAVPTLLERADLVTTGERGHGVVELIDRLVTNDLAELAPRLMRHHILVGRDLAGHEIRIRPYAINVLISGTSGSGKSTLATAFLERLVEQRLQLCVIDPEGDYEQFLDAALAGSPQQAPDVEKVIRLLENPRQNVIVNLHGVSLDDRPLFFAGLLTRLEELRTRTGHPHWIVIDEAHHVLPSTWERSALSLPQRLDRMLFITLEEADLVAATALTSVDTVIVLGSEAAKTFDRFARAANVAMPPPPTALLEPGEAVFWSKETATACVMKIVPGATQRRRHSRKYAEGDLGPDRSFYFRGPEEKLNLRAQNLIVFLQMAEGVDDETWLFHLHRGEYSHWFREKIKDPLLGDDAAAIELQMPGSAVESRAAIKALVEKHYTLPGGPATPVTAAPEGETP